jgi:hypothetical protein
MAMNIDALERTLKKAFGNKLNYEVDREAETIKIDWKGWDHYRDPQGEDSLRVVLVLANGGEYLEVAAPGVYDASECRHIGALSRLLLGVSLRTNVAQFSFDETDGEVRATAEMVLMDGTCTPKQLHATIGILTAVIDAYHPHIARVMDTGEISFPDEGTIVRPTLEDSESQDGPLGRVDVDGAVREALAKARETGRKMWEGAAPARDVGRHG